MDNNIYICNAETLNPNVKLNIKVCIDIDTRLHVYRLHMYASIIICLRAFELEQMNERKRKLKHSVMTVALIAFSNIYI